MGHARAIRLHEHVVDEEETDVDVHHFGEIVGAFASLETHGQQLQRVVGRPSLRQDQRLALLGRDDGLPPVVPLERRQLSATGEALNPVVERARLRGRGRQSLDERPQRASRRADDGGEPVAHVIGVAPEELVSALAGKRHLDVLPGELGDEERRNRRGVRERLVVRFGQRREKLCYGRVKNELVVVRRVALRDEPRSVAFIEMRLVESDREGAHAGRALLRGEGGQQARVDPAREQDSHRHVCDEMGADRVAKALPQLLGKTRVVFRANLVGRCRGRLSVLLDRHRRARAFPNEHVSWQELPSLREDRQRCGNEAESEKSIQRVEVDLPREIRLDEQRLQLGPEREAVLAQPVIERLDPESVAGED